MFGGLTEKLSNAFKKFKNKGKLTEADVKEGMREVKLALLEADVNFKVVKDFVKTVTEKAVGEQVLESLVPAQQIIKIVHEELINLMGGESPKINISPKPPTIIMMVGLPGAGKTTHAGKIANRYTQKGKNPLLVACDVYRPAAIDQLHIVGESVNVPVFSMGSKISPVEIAKAGVQHAKKNGHDMVLIDTAGRLHIDEALMAELVKIKESTEPAEILLTVDAMTGQDAVNVAKSFNELLDITGVVLTKMDGDTRGGAALSIKAVVGKPIKFVSTGEKMEALDVFHPSRIADRILGMGDVVSLVEKAQEQFDEAQARELKKKLAKDQFTLWDFYNQIQQIKKMGNIKDLASMIPGVGKALKDVDMDNDSFKGVEAIILSMTPYEREHPECLNGSRRKRIADGSGTSLPEVNKLLKQFEGTRKMMKTVMGAGQMGAMMGRHGGKKRR